MATSSLISRIACGAVLCGPVVALASAGGSMGMGGAVRVTPEPLNVAALSQMVIGLVVVLVLIVAMSWLLRRMGRSRLMGSGVVKILAGLPLGSKERVLLMQVEDVKLLIGVTAERIDTLYVLHPPAGAPERPPAFGDRLASAMKDREYP
jgi:flagellar protein FliO/FliZ